MYQYLHVCTILHYIFRNCTGVYGVQEILMKTLCSKIWCILHNDKSFHILFEHKGQFMVYTSNHFQLFVGSKQLERCIQIILMADIYATSCKRISM